MFNNSCRILETALWLKSSVFDHNAADLVMQKKKKKKTFIFSTQGMGISISFIP
jgi:hypothetical protein